MRKNNLLDALFPHIRQQLLSTLLIQPERKWYLSDLAHHLSVQPSSLQRELKSLTEAGILRRAPDGNRVYYSAETLSPILQDLQGIFTKTIGLADKIQACLEPFLPQLDFAFIYGSVARGEATVHSDIDLMLIGSVRMTDLSLPLRNLENELKVPVNITHYTIQEFADKLAQGNHFLSAVMQSRKIFLKGSNHELEHTLNRPTGQDPHDKPTRT